MLQFIDIGRKLKRKNTLVVAYYIYISVNTCTHSKIIPLLLKTNGLISQPPQKVGFSLSFYSYSCILECVPSPRLSWLFYCQLHWEEGDLYAGNS